MHTIERVEKNSSRALRQLLKVRDALFLFCWISMASVMLIGVLIFCVGFLSLLGTIYLMGLGCSMLLFVSPFEVERRISRWCSRWKKDEKARVRDCGESPTGQHIYADGVSYCHYCFHERKD